MPGRRVRLRTILALLVISTTVPLGLFAAWVIRNLWHQQQAIVERQNVEQARAVSVAIDQEIERTMAALHVLAALQPIDEPDRTHFTEIAARMIPLHHGWQAVRLVDTSLRVLADTLQQTPGPSTTLANPDWVTTIIESRRPAVSNVWRDAGTGRWVLAVGVPVFRQNRLTYVLGARLYASAFSDLLRRQRLPPDGVLTLLDAQPSIIARTRNEDKYIGRRPTADFIERSRTTPEGSWRTVLLEGNPAYAAWSRSALTGWTVGIALPREALDAPTRRSMTFLVMALVAILGAGVLMAMYLSRGIVRAQSAAAAAARALARGEAAEPFHSDIAEAEDLGAGLREAAVILETRLRERDEAQREADRHRAAMFEREQAARRAAEALSRAKDEFVATVSHELRTPLNAIFGWVAMLKAGVLDAERQAHAVEVIDRNTRAQAQLIEDLLDMSRVIRGSVRLEMQPVELGAVLDAAVDSLRPTAEARQITLRAATPSQPAVVSGDQGRLQQILWNLLANSLKFTPSGGQIDVGLDIVGDEAVVRITDTGEGIAPEFLPHVFDRFRQETADVTRTHSGLGIGLSLVRYLTELHGGRVGAESEGKGRGATFTVRLPLLGAYAGGVSASHPARPLPLPGEPVLAGLHVLVVDDDPDAIDLVTTALRQAGARVTQATSANEALDTLRAELVDLLVSDIAMPGGSGYELVRALRERSPVSAIPAIAITAYSRPEDHERAIAEGFDAHVGKPFDPRALVGLIATLTRAS